MQTISKREILDLIKQYNINEASVEQNNASIKVYIEFGNQVMNKQPTIRELILNISGEVKEMKSRADADKLVADAKAEAARLVAEAKAKLMLQRPLKKMVLQPKLLLKLLLPPKLPPLPKNLPQPPPLKRMV